MKDGNLLIAHNQDNYEIKVAGRANFEYGVPLRTFANCIGQQKINTLKINLGSCYGMDSTFMGVLTMLALKLKKLGKNIEIFNISQDNLELLRGLGINKLFNYSSDQQSENDQLEQVKLEPNNDQQLATAETVVEAHETLMKADDKNINKFKQVSKFAKADAERLSSKAQ